MISSLGSRICYLLATEMFFQVIVEVTGCCSSEFRCWMVNQPSTSGFYNASIDSRASEAVELNANEI